MTATREYLVSHGCAAALSRCRARGLAAAQRGDAVVIRSARGLELGTILCEAPPDLPAISPGELLRHATADDRRAAQEMQALGLKLLDSAQHFIEADLLPLLPLDAEVLLDRSQAIMHLLRWDQCTLTPFVEQLQSHFDLKVTLLDRSKPDEQHGCGSCGDGGCGSCGEGGGCSSGNCSRGSMKSAEELTRYFAELRQQMQALQRVPLL
jgi:hypothetical protein